jgi:predicted RNase H-like nuclease (RuvC/YqgF family)
MKKPEVVKEKISTKDLPEVEKTERFIERYENEIKMLEDKIASYRHHIDEVLKPRLKEAKKKKEK